MLAERLPRRSAAIISRFRSSSQKERKKSGQVFVAVLSKSFFFASPPSLSPFQSQVDQTFADEAFPFWCWGTCHGLLLLVSSYLKAPGWRGAINLTY